VRPVTGVVSAAQFNALQARLNACDTRLRWVEGSYVPGLQAWARTCEVIARANYPIAHKIREFYGDAYEFKEPSQPLRMGDMPTI